MTNEEFQIYLNEDCSKDTVYLITPASEEELRTGNYIDINGWKISNNPKKHAMITNIGVDKNDK